MSAWAGFSDAELRRLQQSNADPDRALPVAPVVPVVSGRGRKPVAVTRSRQQIQREQAMLQSLSRSESKSEPRHLPPDQRLSSTKPSMRSPPGPEQGTKPESSPNIARPGPELELNGKKEMSEEPETKEAPVLKELEKQEVEIRERSRLEQLQIQQKEMEEQNQKKKALLARTIAEKSKQTRAETLKLQKIQKELQTLDDMVSHDVSILRDRIEQASYDYSNARKRYEKAEAEFIMAKLELHKKTELKEQLTEHLCAIIQQNELRKAKKLEELMERLQLHEETTENQPHLHVEEESREKTAQSASGETSIEKTAQSASGETSRENTAQSASGEESNKGDEQREAATIDQREQKDYDLTDTSEQQKTDQSKSLNS